MEKTNDKETLGSVFSAIEAMLFASGSGLSLEQISVGLDKPVPEIKLFLEELTQIYEKKKRGIKIISVGENYQMATNQEYGEYLKRVNQKTIKNLTKAQIETLSVIAYKQPATKQDIEQVRGVDSTHPINKLLEYELIVDNGRLDTPGRPILFITTDEFLRQFGMSNISDLPNIDMIKNLN